MENGLSVTILFAKDSALIKGPALTNVEADIHG